MITEKLDEVLGEYKIFITHTVPRDTCHHTKFRCASYRMPKIIVFSLLVFSLLCTPCKEKFSIERFFIKDYIQEIYNIVNCKILKKKYVAH